MNELEVIKVIGSPGTGKTHTTLDFAEKEFEKGTNAQNLLYFSYTVAASEEGRKRIAERINCEPDELGENWRTIHSECFHLLNLNPVQTADGRKRKEFCDELGITFSLNEETKDASEVEQRSPGNELFAAYDWLRSRIRPIEGLDGPFSFENTAIEPTKFMMAWEGHKKKNGLVDFQDMLAGVLRYDLKPKADVMIVDEFQDLTPLQFQVYKLWKDEMNKVYIAGDPAQAIYTFGGAEPKFLTEEKCDEEILLKETYRLPKKIWEPSQKILQNLHNVKKFDIKPRNAEGEFKYFESEINKISRGLKDMRLIEELKKALDEEKSAMALFRTRKQSQKFENTIIEDGIPFRAMRGFEVWTPRLTNLRDGIVEILTEGKTHKEKKRAVTTLLGKDLHEGTSEMYRFIQRIREKTGFYLAPYQRSDEQKDHPLNYFQAKALTRNLEEKIFIDPETIRIGTKHSAKGKEAQVVLTSLDTSKTIAETMYLADNFIDDKEKRVDFVALTRASERLIVSESAFAGYPNHTLEQLQVKTPEELMTNESI